MKKFVIMLVIGGFISTSMMSCTAKCGRCKTNGNLGDRFCTKDNKIVYDAAVASCATGGGTWERE
jgi:hypothetical protein